MDSVGTDVDNSVRRRSSFVRGTLPMRGLARLLIICLFLPQSLFAETIRLLPQNPRYFLFRGKAVALISSGEHYGAVTQC
jgi:hypothetical protein